MLQTDGPSPVLFHIAVSHYSEKVRWALDHKQLGHVRRTPLPGLHIPVAFWLSRAQAFTLPILELDGRRIADSTAIIGALEQRVSEPALYPHEPRELRRALALEDWFDEQLGPYVRRLAFYELRRDRALLGEMSARVVPSLADKLGPDSSRTPDSSPACATAPPMAQVRRVPGSGS